MAPSLLPLVLPPPVALLTPSLPASFQLTHLAFCLQCVSLLFDNPLYKEGWGMGGPVVLQYADLANPDADISALIDTVRELCPDHVSPAWNAPWRAPQLPPPPLVLRTPGHRRRL